MERDLIGFGEYPPKMTFPESARIAVNFVLNYEEGAESNVLEGDKQSEDYLTDLPGLKAVVGERHLSCESLFEFGSRRGVWRLLALFETYNLPLTLFATGRALEQNPELSEKLKRSPHDIAGHGYRWINYRNVSAELEREHIKKTIDVISKTTGKSVSGWYTGRCSKNTRKLIVESGLRYDSDSYADDLPYWTTVINQPHLIIPYNLDCNDARYAMMAGWSTGDDFFQYLKATFDCLYREGKTNPQVMTVGLHARFSGRPGRSEALKYFLDYMMNFEKVWICKREEIADIWYKMRESNE